MYPVLSKYQPMLLDSGKWNLIIPALLPALDSNLVVFKDAQYNNPEYLQNLPLNLN